MVKAPPLDCDIIGVPTVGLSMMPDIYRFNAIILHIAAINWDLKTLLVSDNLNHASIIDGAYPKNCSTKNIQLTWKCKQLIPGMRMKAIGDDIIKARDGVFRWTGPMPIFLNHC